MAITKIDTLSPALLGGLIGVAVTGDQVGFFVGAVSVWFLLTCTVIAAALVSTEAERQSTAVAHVQAE